MESGTQTKKLLIGGMTCPNCQDRIARKLLGAAGISGAEVDYREGTAVVSYDADVISFAAVAALIESLDYRVLSKTERRGAGTLRVAGFLAVIAVLYALLERFGVLNLLVPGQLAGSGMGYGMLFVIGLLTSVHCIAMCGGINLSQSIPHGGNAAGRFSTFVPALLYNGGRVISYTAVGCILGLAGSIVGGGSEIGLPVMLQGMLKLIAGVFMVIMGLNMLGLFPWMRRLLPGMPKILTGKADAEKTKGRGPLLVGLLNGLMPCGPLQSMQIVALASGNPWTGALSMLLFSLGTVPLMLGLGSVVAALGKRFTQTVMTVGAVLVVVLGLAMLSQGGGLSGLLSPDLLLWIVLALCVAGVASSLPFRKTAYKKTLPAAILEIMVLALAFLGSSPVPTRPKPDYSAVDSGVQVVDGVQIVNSTLSSRRYPNITVRAGSPVKWVVDAPQGSINGCNGRMLIREYDIDYSFVPGENVIEFTPQEAGVIRYSCWMGMIYGSITVVDA